MAKEDRAALLRTEIEELREEAATLAEKAKRTARQAEVLASRQPANQLSRCLLS